MALKGRLIEAVYCLLSATSAEADTGISVGRGSEIVLRKGATVSLSGDLRAQGRISVAGRIELGGNLEAPAGQFEASAELRFVGPSAHQLDLPRDAGFERVELAGSISGTIAPIWTARHVELDPGSTQPHAGPAQADSQSWVAYGGSPALPPRPRSSSARSSDEIAVAPSKPAPPLRPSSPRHARAPPSR